MTETTARLTAALADRYAIEREIGAGGMATVYLAKDLKHDRDCRNQLLGGFALHNPRAGLRTVCQSPIAT